MRGKAGGHNRGSSQGRITPAHAGKSCKKYGRWYARWDHPRPCGEKFSSNYSNVRHLGSPPPMRGKDVALHVVACQIRITPAHAGKRRIFGRTACAGRDHPRPCGEKPERCSRSSAMTGITPAHAGKRLLLLHTLSSIWDHPRPCGEKNSRISCYFTS